ncbi:MAG: LLM class flavin-dependent oxidoreductase [Candidatus Binataceae bacterium]|jgi:probable F420-dependent oxidoreductase
MTNPRLGLVMLTFGAAPLKKNAELVREAEALGYTALWAPEVVGPDAFITLAAYALNTSRIELGTGVIPIQIRTPGITAMSFLTLNELSGGRALAGLGVSSPVIVERWHGASYAKPLTAMRECIQVMRQLFTEGRSKFDGRVYKSDFRLGMRLTQKPPRIYVAALNPPMLRLAGQLADGVLFNYSPPEAMPDLIAEVRAGAIEAGRDPDAIDTGVYVRMCVTPDERAGIDAFKREVAGYAFVESYKQMFARYGMAEEFAEVRNRWQAGKRDDAFNAISDASAARIGVVGSAEKARAFVARFRQAGITHPIIFPIGPANTIERDFANTMRALAGA